MSSSRIFVALSLVAVVCLTLAALGGLFWANVRYVRSAGLDKSFLVSWSSLQIFAQHGLSPYEEATAQHIQMLYYGRMAHAGEDPLRLTLPPLFAIFYLPLALIPDYTLARSLWMTFNEIALGGIALLTLRLTAWKIPRRFIPLFLLFVLFWPYSLLGLFQGDASIFTTLTAIGAWAALRDEKDELAGALMVIALGQPVINGPLLIFLFAQALSQRRSRVYWGFLMFFTILTLLTFFLLPDCFWPWLRNLLQERPYQHGLHLQDILATWWPVLGRRLGWLLSGSLTVVLLIEWILARRRGDRRLLWVTCLTIAATPLLGMRHPLTGQVALVLPTVQLALLIGERWGGHRRGGLPYVVLMMIFAGLWTWSTILFTQNEWANLRCLLFAGLAVFLLIGLYWLRWYAIRVPRPYWENLRR